MTANDNKSTRTQKKNLNGRSRPSSRTHYFIRARRANVPSTNTGNDHVGGEALWWVIRTLKGRWYKIYTESRTKPSWFYGRKIKLPKYFRRIMYAHDDTAGQTSSRRPRGTQPIHQRSFGFYWISHACARALCLFIYFFLRPKTV